MKFLVKGDDLGWTDGINAGIEKCAREGILTMTGCMVNMPAAERGLKMLMKYPHVAIGQHTNIVNGKPLSDPEKVPHLIQENGEFRSTKYYRSMMKEVEDVIPYYDEVRLETQAQIDRFIEITGRKPDYLEGHSVPSPTAEKAIEDAAAENGIIFIGQNDETSKYNVHLTGIGNYAHAIFSDPDPMKQFYADPISCLVNDEMGLLKYDCVVMTFHPGFVDADIMKQSGQHSQAKES